MPAARGPVRDPAPAADPPRLHRRAEGRLLAGVATGLADHLRVDPLYVRVAFCVLVGVGGLGALLYLAFWAVVPQEPAGAGGRRARSARADRGQTAALAVLAVGTALLVRTVGLGGSDAVVWPALIAGAGIALLWRQADDGERARWARMSPRFPWMAAATGTSRRALVLRVAAGGALVALGAGAFLAVSGELQAARDGLVAIAVVVAGLGLISAPWWWRLASDLGTERRERIRSQERAEVAAHLHDSVLQTLALIQRHVDEPREVARLARGQERELRAWLYRSADQPRQDAFAAAVEAVAAEVEDAYAVTVEAVVVRDCPLDDATSALVQATREALVNAGKHAGVATVALYAEVEGDRVSVYVRDRGAGFDRDAVPGDRHGLSGSIVGRMERYGGTATIRSTPGAGTEVELTMPWATMPRTKQ
ncbi:MAG TPA: PspC domain-containing protein [Frankiaceae bacterium]|nr:PspC domain-containing protein [Frankiaceae bacterium]